MKKLAVIMIVCLLLIFSWSLPLRTLDAAIGHPWPMFMHDAQHTGRSPYAGPVSADLKWVFDTGDEIWTSPCIAEDGTIYCIPLAEYGSSSVYALKPDGQVKWTYSLPSDKRVLYSSPALSPDGKIFFGTAGKEGVGGGITALNKDGTLAWEFEAGDVYRSPVIFEDTIIFGSSDHNCYRLSLSGELIAYVPTGGYIDTSPAVAPDGTYYFGSCDGYLYAVHPSQGVKWQFQVGERIYGSPSVGPDGTIYFGAGDGKLHALNPDGTEKWSIQLVLNCAPAIGQDETIYIGDHHGIFYALNPQNGSVKWRYETGWTDSEAIDKNGNIYVGSRDHKVYALRPDGSLLWSFETGGPIYGSPAIGADGTLYIGSSDGNLYAFGTPEPPSLRIVQPEGGEKILVGQTYEIRWETLNPPQNVYLIRIELSLNGGPYKLLAEGQDTGSFSWIPDSTSERAKIRISLLNTEMEKLAEATSEEFRIVSSSEPTFSDVSSDYWANLEIKLLAGKEVINGYPDGTFRPENPVTRAEFAKMALLALGYSQERPEGPTFPDVPKQEWYYGYVEGAVKHGLVEGYPDGTFKPEGNITIAEVLTVIVRAKELPLSDPPPIILIMEGDSLRQINSGDWFYQYVGAAANGHLILFPDYRQIIIPGPGSGDYYIVKFNSPATRAQTAVFLSRLWGVT